MKKIGIGVALLGVVVLAALWVRGQGPLDTHPWVVAAFGPPKTPMQEVFANTQGTATFSHATFDGVLKTVVKDGQVDYNKLVKHPDELDEYLRSIEQAPFDELSRDGKLALLINAYNAFTLKLILDHYPLASIKDIPAPERWDAKRWTFAGRTVSLTQLEHEFLRAKFAEPRIHFAINCASVGCPPLKSEAYVPERLEEQLQAATTFMHHDPRWLRIQRNSALSVDTVHLTKLYSWYGADFAQAAGEPLNFAGRYVPELNTGDWRIEWIDYSWALNGIR